jgi:diguanylate cyclase (GGDEF)-like protein
MTLGAQAVERPEIDPRFGTRVERRHVIAFRSGQGGQTAAVVAIVAAVALGVAALPHVALPRLAILSPVAYFIAFLSDVATAAMLLATWRSSPSLRSRIGLALIFLSSAGLLFATILMVPLLPSVPALVEAPPQSGVWLFLLWHAAIALGAFTYAALRINDRAPSRRFVIGAVAVAASVVSAILIVAIGFSDRLPTLVVGTDLAAVVSTGVGPTIAAMLGIACVLVFRIRTPSPIDRAYAFSILLMFLELAVLLIDGHRYTASYYFVRLLVLAAATLVLVSVERTLLHSRARLVDVERTLRRVVGESVQRVDRVRAVWQIASYPERSDAEDFAAILEIAAVALRPNTGFIGLLSHLEGGRLIIDATSTSAFDPLADTVTEGLHTGSSFAAEETMAPLLLGEERARGWDDLRAVAESSTIGRGLGMRSFIGAQIATTRGNAFVTFTSPSPTSNDPYEEDDLAYVEVIAAFFSNRFKHQHQIERMQFQLEHDALTGLVNRVYFRTAVREAIRSGEPFAVAFLDLNGFRLVNEREGNQIGDELLVAVGNALRTAAGGDVIGRMSADEFGIVVHGAASIHDVAAAIERYLAIFATPFRLGDRLGEQLLTVGACVGAARFPADGASPEDLMRRADVALDVAKSSGAATTTIFHPTMESIAEEAARRVVELTEAIAGNQLAVVYQPTFELSTRKIIGAEALVRWDHPVRGRLAPIEFIGLAERNGLIASLSHWVLHQVVRDVLSVPVFPPGFRVYFNVAAPLLEDAEFIADTKEALQAQPRLARHLGIEVTETTVMQSVERASSTLELFRSWGLSVAIDDFGTGYSSLSYLKALTVDVIKLDRSFVTGLPTDPRDCAIAEMLLHMTERFGYATLAEGIETEAQVAWLLEHGCRYGQGFLIARPQPFEELLECLGLPPTQSMRAV